MKSKLTQKQIKLGWIEIYRPEIYEYRYFNNRTGKGCNTLEEVEAFCK